MSSPLAALYNAAPIILWVEDLTTSVYLDTLWESDARIKIYVGGGHETLKAVVEDERRNNHRRSLYSLRDRDFGPTNRPRWRAEDTWHFALETFEVECFLLDPIALTACQVNTAAKTESWIRAHLEQQARELLWWMACRAVLADLREARQERFPGAPKRASMTSMTDAEAYLLTSEWVLATVPNLPAAVAADRLRGALTAAHTRYEAFLGDGTWPTHISGKELLAELVSHVYTKGRPAGDAARQDLAKAVAAAQLRLGREPGELLELKQVLLERLARAAA